MLRIFKPSGALKSGWFALGMFFAWGVGYGMSVGTWWAAVLMLVSALGMFHCFRQFVQLRPIVVHSRYLAVGGYSVPMYLVRKVSEVVRGAAKTYRIETEVGPIEFSSEQYPEHASIARLISSYAA